MTVASLWGVPLNACGSLRAGCAGWCSTSTPWSRASVNWPPCSAPCPPTRRTSSFSSPCWRAFASRSTTRSWWDGRDAGPRTLFPVFFLFRSALLYPFVLFTGLTNWTQKKLNIMQLQKWIRRICILCSRVITSNVFVIAFYVSCLSL